MTDSIFSICCSYDNKSAAVSDWSGNIKIIRWKPEAISEKDFDFDQKSKRVGRGSTEMICMGDKDDKYILVGSEASLCIYELATRRVIKEFMMTSIVMGIKMLGDGKKAAVAERNGNIYVIDIETHEMTLIAENVTSGKRLWRIAVI